ncbi:hypothetical protein FISHEDRAFT_78393 [Fistulina hepatica ATCC 64428]|nr:hypothetical protein FISHEDRAFT_78393 [Fistulina hepatica ATCC 64428]
MELNPTIPVAHEPATDAPDSDLEDDEDEAPMLKDVEQFFLDSDDDSDLDDNSEELAFTESWARQPSALETFTRTLHNAHEAALKAQREQEARRVRPKQYKIRPSKRTMYRHKQQARILESKGYLSVADFMEYKRREVITKTVTRVADNVRTGISAGENATLQQATHAVIEEAARRAADLLESKEAAENARIAAEHAMRVREEAERTIAAQYATCESDSEPQEAAAAAMDAAAVADRAAVIASMLADVRAGRKPVDPTDIGLETKEDVQLNTWQDRPALFRAQAHLKVKSKDHKLDVIFRARISGMLATLNFFLDPNLTFTWREASLMASKAQGGGEWHARILRTWLHEYLKSGPARKLPLHRYGSAHSTVLIDEDISSTLQLALVEKVKSGYLTAQTLVELVASEEIQMKLEAANIRKRSISLRTAQCWLKHFGWRYEHVRKGMYIDGHERDDVVAYRQEFLGRWKEYERRMVTYDSETGEPTFPKGFPITPGTPFRLILITQDECTFYANDQPA